MSIKTDNLVPKFANEDPTTFYDLIVDINSFRHLQKEGNNDKWGWNVLIKKGFNYDEAKIQDFVSIGVVGNGNRGKSFLLSKISGFDFPRGYSVKTKGISVKYPEKKDENSKSIVIFDSAGFETPLVEASDFKLGQIISLFKVLIIFPLIKLIFKLNLLEPNGFIKYNPFSVLYRNPLSSIFII